MPKSNRVHAWKLITEYQTELCVCVCVHVYNESFFCCWLLVRKWFDNQSWKMYSLKNFRTYENILSAFQGKMANLTMFWIIIYNVKRGIECTYVTYLIQFFQLRSKATWKLTWNTIPWYQISRISRLTNTNNTTFYVMRTHSLSGIFWKMPFFGRLKEKL